MENSQNIMNTQNTIPIEAMARCFKYSNLTGVRIDDRVFEAIQGHETNPIVGGEYCLKEVEKRNDNSPSTGPGISIFSEKPIFS